MSFFSRGPSKAPPVEVVDVRDRPVPMQRAFDWIAVTLQAFRERPLPASYYTVIQPTADIFGTSRINEVQFEQTLGDLGDVEVLQSEVPTGKWRQYLSLEFQHDDGTPGAERRLQAIRVVNVAGSFPSVALGDAVSDGIAPPLQIYSVGGFAVPPLARAGAQIDTIGVGARITVRSLFLELDVGEPAGVLA